MKISRSEYERRYQRLGHEVHDILTRHMDLDMLRASLDKRLLDLLVEGMLLFRPLYKIEKIPGMDDYDIHFDSDHLQRCFGEVANG